MKKFTFYFLAALMSFPQFASAQVYKCKKDDGSVSIQDHSCQGSARTVTVLTNPVPNQAFETAPQAKEPRSRTMQKTSGATESWQEKERDLQRRRIESENNAIKKSNEEIMARNKMSRCNHARQQLGVLNELRPVYSRDNGGNRHYLEDGARDGEIAAAERRVAAECQ